MFHHVTIVVNLSYCFLIISGPYANLSVSPLFLHLSRGLTMNLLMEYILDLLTYTI